MLNNNGSEKILSIVHVLAPAPFGGLETVVKALVSGQIALGDDSCIAPIVSGDSAGRLFVEGLESAGLPFVPIQVKGRRYRQERAAVQGILVQRSADILHTHGYRPDVLHSPLGSRLGIPTVTTVHGFTGGGRKNRFYEFLQRRAFRNFDAVVAVSEKLRGDLLDSHISPARIHTVQNAFQTSSELKTRSEARALLAIPPQRPNVCWVGRMTPEKAPDIMILALARTSHSKLHLSMIGTGPMHRKCEALAESEGVASRCRWHGMVSGAGQLLPAFDAIVISSWTEGTPMVLLEAMAANVPIITTSVGGIPDVVSRKEAKLVVPGDIGGLASAIDEVLSDPPAAAIRSANAKKRLERDFSIEQWVKRYRDIYIKL
jgi:glycosyltransferase involved in cell wall biosynthesis